MLVEEEELFRNLKPGEIICPRCGYPGTGPYRRYTKYPDKLYPYVHHSEKVRQVAALRGIHLPKWCYISKKMLSKIEEHENSHYLTQTKLVEAYR